METMARRQTPDDERIHKLGLAKIINQSHGAPVCTVWDVDDLPPDWVDFFLAFSNDLPRAMERQKKIDEGFQAFEAAHPQYGKRQ